MSGGVVVRLLHKTKVMDRAMAMVGQGLTMQDVGVLYYLCSSLDGQTGEAVRRYQTIADAGDFSRATAVRCIQRLKAAGLVEIRQRFYNKRGATRGQVATAFRLGATALAEVGAQVNRGSVHSCTTNSPSRSFHNPGEPAQEKQAVQGEPRNGPSEAVQASMAARIVERSNAGGTNYHDLKSAHDDLRSWASSKGWQAITAALGRAESVGPNGRGLRGAAFIDYLNDTYDLKDKGSGDQSQRTTTPPGRPAALAGDAAAQDRRRVGGAGGRGRERRCA